MMRLPVQLTRGIAKVVLKTKKNSPHILFAGGLVGVGTSTFLACRATLKLEPVLDDANVRVEKAKVMHEGREKSHEYNRALAIAYLRGVKDIAVLYGPAVLVGAAGIAALATSHTQLNRRNTALMAGYTALSQTLEEYRARVREEIGEEKEREIYLNAKEQTVVGEDGKKVKVMVPDGVPNQHAKFFDRNNGNWKPDVAYNRFFLKSQQEFANQHLYAKGYVMLNDVYDWLGFPRTTIGQLVGWVVGGEGDGYVDFGLDDFMNATHTDPVGWSCLLDFNVDPGVVWDKI